MGTEIFLGGAEQDDVTYPVLLSILRANGLAAVEIEGRVNIVPAYEVRFYATPIVPNDDNRIAADEWVTRILITTNVDAPILVPILAAAATAGGSPRGDAAEPPDHHGPLCERAANHGDREVARSARRRPPARAVTPLGGDPHRVGTRVGASLAAPALLLARFLLADLLHRRLLLRGGLRRCSFRRGGGRGSAAAGTMPSGSNLNDSFTFAR